MPGFPFNILYRTVGSDIEVLVVAPHRRRPGYWVSRISSHVAGENARLNHRNQPALNIPPMNWLDHISWDAQGLVPVIAQEQGSKDVLMFAWMNREALQKTAESGRAVYFSRSRGKLWFKGEESGHVQLVHDIRLDCDNDVVLLTVTQTGHDPGIACHTGRHSCFYQRWQTGADGGQWLSTEPVLQDPALIYKKTP